MSLILIFLVILAPSAAIAIYFDRKIEETIAVTCFIFIISVYLFGLAGVMLLGVYVCIAIAVLSGTYAIFKVIKDKTVLFKNILLPGLIFLFFCFALVWWAHRYRMFTSWDEFSHWGLVVKNMYILNSFGDNPAATTIFKSYPPATALFQYLWCKLSGSFNDFHVIRSMNILCLALLLPIFKCIDWKSKRFIIPLGLIIILLPIMFYSEFYTTVYVDGILGLLFAYILFSYFTSKKLDTFCIINISLGLFILSLTKEAGMSLAIIALIIIAIDILVFKRDTSPFKIKRANVSRLIVIGTMLISILIAYYSWKIYLKLSNTPEIWNGFNDITLANIIDLLREAGPEYKYTVINNFFKALMSENFNSYMFNMNYVLWIVLSVAAGGVLLHFIKDTLFRKRLKFAILGILGGCAVYTLGLLVLYLFIYSEYEAVRLAAYQRYLSTYLLSMITFLVLMLIYNFLKEKNSHSKMNAIAFILIGILLFINTTPLLDITIFARQSISSSRSLRAPYEKINRFSDLFDSKKDKVFIIAQNTRGFDYWVIYYNLTPVKINYEEPWSIGMPYDESDIYTYKCSCDEWLKVLGEKYTYVYLYKIDDQFIKEFGAAFKDMSSIKRDSLYKVIKVGEKVYLEYVDD